MKNNKKDLLNQKFGRLTVIKETDKRQDRCIVWLCKCECGNTVEVSSKRLINNIVSSCGCLQKEVHKKSISKLRDKQLIEQTNIDLISKKECNSNSKTGVRGVCYITSKRKYKASLYLNKKYYLLGFFDNIEDAIKARKRGEEQYFKPILEKYNKKAD